ncbi:MAG: DUF5106 domain-containing protein [Muribaculaceae bacterium]|nr:DUF5106 domain-containing protein [Muribaculaceae bacterium]
MSTTKSRLLAAGLALLALAACRNGKTEAEEAPTRFVAGAPGQLLLPAVPDSIADTGDRAAYVARHFWEALDFGRDARALDTAFMEQTFANFLAVLGVTPPYAARDAVTNFLNRAAATPATHDLALHISDRYLDDPNSPMRNEEQLMMFLLHSAADTTLEPARREAAAIRLEIARKNLPGTPPADFSLLMADGRRSTLRACLSGHATLMMFYDPDCEQCKEITKRLAELELPETLQILAIDMTGDKKRWMRTKASMPAAWSVVFALDPIEEEETYVFRATPTFYLVGEDGKIILKDPDPSAILGS